MPRRHFYAFLEKDPRNLLRLLVTVALVSIVLILSVSAFGIHKVYSQHLIAQAEEDAVHVSRAIMALEGGFFVRADDDGRWRIEIDAESVPILDKRLRYFLRHFNIVKIKLFNKEHLIVYSTDPTIIGRSDPGNLRLKRALTGINDSMLVSKEEVLDLADEKKIDVDVVETYVPIFGPHKEVIGSFEIYRDVTPYRNDIRRATQQSVVVLGGILLIVFAASFVVVKIGTDQLERVQRQLREMASRDPLTGILNRREIMSRTRAEIARLNPSASAGESSLGVIMIDVDHFKTINDTYGHPAGDQVLREISERIQNSVRKSDFVGRFGGEEFLVVLPGACVETTRLLAERIRQAVRSEPFKLDGSIWKATVSIGTTLTRGDEEFALALKRADEALYEAKNAGRDQVSEKNPDFQGDRFLDERLEERKMTAGHGG